MEQTFIKELAAIVGQESSITDPEGLACYGYDSTPELESRPAAVILPGSAEEIARVMALCHNAGVTVTPRGSGPTSPAAPLLRAAGSSSRPAVSTASWRSTRRI